MKCINKSSIEYLFWSFGQKQDNNRLKRRTNIFWSFSIVLICSLLLSSAVSIYDACVISFQSANKNRLEHLHSKHKLLSFLCYLHSYPACSFTCAFVASLHMHPSASSLFPRAPNTLHRLLYSQRWTFFGAQNHRITLDTTMRQNW